MSMITSWSEVTKQYPTSEAIDQIARLVSYIGQQTGMKYGTKSSGTKTSRLASLFTEYGIIDYGDDKSIEVLKTTNGIIVISGYRAKHGWGPWKHYVDGHAFLADGYVKYDKGDDPYYLHLNYGWGPAYNKDVYVLSSQKEWDEEKGWKAYRTIFPHKIDFYTFTYPYEKNW